MGQKQVLRTIKNHKDKWLRASEIKRLGDLSTSVSAKLKKLRRFNMVRWRKVEDNETGRQVYEYKFKPKPS